LKLRIARAVLLMSLSSALPGCRAEVYSQSGRLANFDGPRGKI
jgi:hypothetical protein